MVVWEVFSIWNGKNDELNILKSPNESPVMATTEHICNLKIN